MGAISKLQITDVSVFICLVVSNSATLWSVACQAPLSKGFFRQEYWSKLPSPTPGDLLNPGIKPTSLVSSFPLELSGRDYLLNILLLLFSC